MVLQSARYERGLPKTSHQRRTSQVEQMQRRLIKFEPFGNCKCAAGCTVVQQLRRIVTEVREQISDSSTEAFTKAGTSWTQRVQKLQLAHRDWWLSVESTRVTQETDGTLVFSFCADCGAYDAKKAETKSALDTFLDKLDEGNTPKSVYRDGCGPDDPNSMHGCKPSARGNSGCKKGCGC
jgi:hypothetical protein